MSENTFHLIVLCLIVLSANTYAQAPAESASSPQDIPSGGNSFGARGAAGLPSPQASFGWSAPIAPLTSCLDQHVKCPYWAQTGECRKNPTYMINACQAACDNCPNPQIKITCTDKNSQCSNWIQNNQCNTHAAFMLFVCPRGCGFCQTSGTIGYPDAVTKSFETPPSRINPGASCVGKPYACISMPNGPCTDDHRSCSQWASQNECNLNPFYMNQWCTVSCNKCG